MSAKPVIATICFLPDHGHVMPLLRVTRLIANRLGASVTCFLPTKFSVAAATNGFDFHGLASIDQGKGMDLFAELSSRSAFYGTFSNDQDLRDGYWSHLHEAASKEIVQLGERLRALAPTIIVADNHVFTMHYQHIANALGARLVLNRASGTLASRRGPFIRAFGISKTPLWLQAVVERVGYAHAGVLGRWRRLRDSKRARFSQVCEALLDQRILEEFGPRSSSLGFPNHPISTVLGLCVLESRVYPGSASSPRENEVFLRAPPETNNLTLSDPLREWLGQQPHGRVVYVSFGSIVWPKKNMVRSLLMGLREADVSVIWAQSAIQRSWLDTTHFSGRFRFEEFAPQQSLLLSKSINCFITHAGSGGAQEALIGGVPMLCIPFMWDHPYVASLIEQLGAGIRISRRHVTARRVKFFVQRILGEPTFAMRALEAGRSLLPEGTKSETDWIDALAGAQQKANQ